MNRFQENRGVAELVERLRQVRGNVGQGERLASLAGGAALALLAARRRGPGGAVLGALGAALVARGASGFCPVYQALDLDSTDRALRDELVPAENEPGVSVDASVTIARTPDECYAAWRDFSRAPEFMGRISRVEVLDDTRSRWTARGPLGEEWSWESEVVEDLPGELIAWESLPGAELPNRGWVQFHPAAPAGTHTELRYFVQFDPPGGRLGDALTRAFHQAPRDMVKADLRRFRELLQPDPAGRTG
jgi:uncharacterized membrane protein